VPFESAFDVLAESIARIGSYTLPPLPRVKFIIRRTMDLSQDRATPGVNFAAQWGKRRVGNARPVCCLNLDDSISRPAADSDAENRTRGGLSSENAFPLPYRDIPAKVSLNNPRSIRIYISKERNSVSN